MSENAVRDVLGETYTSGEVLAFFRKNKAAGKFYRSMVHRFITKELNLSNYPSISEYKGSGDFYIDLKRFSVLDISTEEYEVFDRILNMDSIIGRERHMRNHCSLYLSYDLVYSCAKFFFDFFRERSFKVIVGQPVDNYVMDVMVRVAAYFNIKYVGLVRFFYPGYLRVTTYGEYNFLREVSESEVDVIFDKLVNKEKTVFVSSRRQVFISNLKYFFIYKAKFILHYMIFSKLLEKKEYDYISTKAQVYPKSSTVFLRLKQFYRETIKETGSKPIVYIPLHYYPEATVEYWVTDEDKYTYYPYLLKIIRRLTKANYHVVLKEHPAMYQRRDKKVLRKLRSFSDVTLLSPFVSTYDVLDKAEFIFVWTGTTGIESYLQNKKVVSVCSNYYNAEFLNSVEDFFDGKVVALTESEKRQLVKRVLTNCLPVK